MESGRWRFRSARPSVPMSLPCAAQARSTWLHRSVPTELVRDQHVLFDNVGNRAWSETSRVLAAGGVNVSVTGPKHAVMGPMRRFAFRKLLSRSGDKQFTWFTAQVKQAKDPQVKGYPATHERQNKPQGPEEPQRPLGEVRQEEHR